MQLCQRKTRQPTLREWRLISAFALLLIRLFHIVFGGDYFNESLPQKCIVAARAPCEFQQSMATIFDSPDCRPLKDSPKPKLIKSYRTIKDSSGSGLNMVWIGTTDMNSRCSHMIQRARTA